MGSYAERMKYVEKRIALNMARAFLEQLKSSIPSGSEYKAYSNSLKIVELKGASTPAFGIISEREKVKLRSVFEGGMAGSTAVYIYPSREDACEVVQLAASINPWPIDLVPGKLPKDDVSLVHRLISGREMEFVRKQATDFIAKNKREFARNGITWAKKDENKNDISGMESLPDYMTLALRTEFGINMNSVPHWKPSIKFVMDNAVEILKKDNRIRDALHDWLFREHTLEQKSEYDDMTQRDFLKETKKFQQALLGGGA
jgi:hypothetical protein